MLNVRPTPCGVASRSRSTGQSRVSVVSRSQADPKTAAAEQIAKQLAALNSQLEATAASVSTGALDRSGPKDSGPELVCDENGCVLIDYAVVDASASLEEVELDHMLTGDGWTLGMLPTGGDGKGSGVLGGSTWRTTISAKELDDFVKALQAVRTTLHRMEGTTRAGAPVKWDTKRVALSAVGSKESFELSFTIGAGSNRVVTAKWNPTIVADLLHTLDQEIPGFAFVPPTKHTVHS